MRRNDCLLVLVHSVRYYRIHMTRLDATIRSTKPSQAKNRVQVISIRECGRFCEKPRLSSSSIDRTQERHWKHVSFPRARCTLGFYKFYKYGHSLITDEFLGLVSLQIIKHSFRGMCVAARIGSSKLQNIVRGQKLMWNSQFRNP